MRSLTLTSTERVTRPRSTARRDTILRFASAECHRFDGVASRKAETPSWQMATPHAMPAPPNHRRKVDASPRLITADAALLLVERWRSELDILRRRSPTSDAARTLSDCVDELSAAITAGYEMTIQLTASEANAISHIPISTLRWLCRRKPEAIGARKREGIWYIDRAQFELYLASCDGHPDIPRADATRVPDADRAIPLSREARADIGIVRA